MLFSVGWKTLVEPRPFWAHYYDPEAIYFFEGFRLLAGDSPRWVDNPGTPVQMLSAALVLLTGRSPLAFDAFRGLGYGLYVALFILSVHGLLRGPLAESSFAAKLLAVWTWCLAPAALEYDTVLSPEMFVFPVGTLLLLTVPGRDPRVRPALGYLALGAVCGLALTVKFTFLPLVAGVGGLAVLVGAGEGLGRWRRAGLAALGTALGFALASIPAAADYPRMFKLTGQMMGHSGEYGTGRAGFPGLEEVLANLARAISGAKVWWLWMFLLGALAAYRWSTRRPRFDRYSISLLLGGAAALLLGLAMAHRHYAGRYVLPAGFGAIALCAGVVRSWGPRWRVHLKVALVAAVGILVWKQVAFDLGNHRTRMLQAVSTRNQLERASAEACGGHKGIRVFGGRAPIPSFALRIMTTDKELFRQIETIYPREGHVDWSDTVILPHSAESADLLIVRERDAERILRKNGLRGNSVRRVGDYSVIRLASEAQRQRCSDSGRGTG